MLDRRLWPVLLVALLLTSCRATWPESNSKRTSAPLSANAWLEINQTAFEHNLAEVKTLVGPRTQVCAVMKADGYGHGLSLLIPSVIKAGVPYVGITSNEEAAAARAAGFRAKLMRLRLAAGAEAEAAFPLEVEELVGNLELARELSRLAREHKRTIKFHLYLNSAGMSRNGLELSTEAGRAAALEILRLPNLRLVGIATHFPVEDAADVRKGLATFSDQSAWIIKEGRLDRSKLLLHTANSYATLEVPESRLDLVRVGGALYGDTVSTRTEYLRVMSFKSRVAAVNPYPAGNTVSYNRTFTLKRDSRLANIPVGYSNGYRRVFSNKAHVLIRGHRCRIVGRVSMNTIMVDVTDHPDITAGDEVVLFGKQGAEEITQTELETHAGTILVDLCTVWGNSNPKIGVR